MADYKATSSTNWSTMTWSPASTPTTGDRVYANNFTVTLDTDIVVTSIHTEANGGISAVAGGGFTWSSTRTITANAYAGTTACITVSGSGTGTFVGNSIGGSGSGAHGITKSTNTALIVIGNGYGGSGLNSRGIVFGGTGGTYTVTGSGYGGSGSGASHGFDITTSALANITGNGYAGTVGHGINISSTGEVNIDGIAVGGTTAGAYGVVSTTASADVTLTSAEFSSNYQVPINGFIKFANSNPYIKVYNKSTASVTLTDSTEIAGQVPSEDDVRYGVTFLLGTKTGKARIPTASQTADGVLVDVSDVGTLSTVIDLTNLNSAISTLNTYNTDLTTQVGYLTTQVTNLTTDVGNLDTSINNLDDSIIDLNTSVGDLNTAISTVTVAGLTDADTFLDELESSIKPMAERMRRMSTNDSVQTQLEFVFND